MSDHRPHIDVLLVVPLAEELDRIYEIFPYVSDHSEEDFHFTKVLSPTSNQSLFVVKLKGMGNGPARDACNFVFERHTVGLIVCCGIAGGLKKDLKLGDVCVSHSVLDLSDQFKIEDKFTDMKIAPSPKHLEVDRNICSRLAFLSEHPRYTELRQGWRDDYLEFLLSIEADHGEEFERFKTHVREEARVFFGPIISHGGVVASDQFSESLKSIDRNVLAVETESAGVFEVAKNNSTPVFTVRGISDYADTNKTQLEIDSEDLLRSLAAKNAALYVFYQLRTATIRTFLDERQTAVLGVDRDDALPERQHDPLETILRELEDEIESELKDKCPAYRHKPKRSLLPSPRALRVGDQAGPDQSTDWDTPSEIADIVEQFERVMISLEPTYPDRALPWVIADMILRTNGSRVYMPIVIDGAQVTPNRFKLRKFERVKQLLETGSHSVTPVIIIDEPNLQSNTRSRALIDEANDNSSARFVIVVKKHDTPVLSLSFAERFNCERFSVANFSLGALADFVSNNFGYDPFESAVLATKLNDTFEQFDMHAHPSYFAGISPESLAALMAANRRAELIHLAVDAALMIMVKDDDADIQVSKRWRREFLKDIAVRQYVKGEKIDEAKAIANAKAVAESRDVEIRPLEFVQSFVRAGILDFSHGHLQFILVYVRDYLVAEYLHEHPRAAASYFDFDEIEEDFNVLDMYAELGPSDQIIDTVTKLIEGDLAFLNSKHAGTVDNLISNRIQLSQFSGFEKFTERRQRLIKGIEYVGENPADLQRKQHLLDLRRSASDRAGRRGVENGGDGNEAASHSHHENDDGMPRRKISAHWSAGCVLLGAGAEQIVAQPKRELVRGVISLGCRVVEQWTSEAASIDYADLRNEVLDDPEFQKRRKEMQEEEWEKLERDFGHLLSFLEYSSVTAPYRTLLAVLCGQANGNILRKSVKETTVSRNFEELTRTVWACELEAGKAEQIFKSSLGRIGKSTILRFVLAEHFISRVYWAKWRAEDRRAFLEVATRILNGLDGQIDKGKMKRMISRTVEV